MFKRLLENNPRQFALLFVIALILMLMGVATLNYIVNPMAQYPTTIFKPLIQTSRKQKIELESALDARPQGLVLGSSRVMKLEPDYLEELTGKTFFNAGVNYGKPEDFLAWLRYYQSKHECWPDVVVIGIDPSSLSSNITADARLMAIAELASQIPDKITWKDRASIWTDLLAWDHTKRSVKSLAYQTLKKEVPPPVEHYRADGLLIYDQREKEIREGTYDLAGPIKYNQHEYLPRYKNFKSLSKQRIQILKEIASKCAANQSRLVIYLTPLHPELASFLSARSDYSKWHAHVADFLRQLSEKHDFDFHDLARIESFNGDPDLFVDGTHPLEPNTRRILDVLFPVPTGANF